MIEIPLDSEEPKHKCIVCDQHEHRGCTYTDDIEEEIARTAGTTGSSESKAQESTFARGKKRFMNDFKINIFWMIF